MPNETIDLRLVNTYSLENRKNLVKLSDLIHPGQINSQISNKDFSQVVDYILKAHNEHRQVIWMMGAHVIKCGLGPLIIDLMEKGIITHIAGNGAVSIHDFELALIGETSEDVATGIEDGTFGMAEETGGLMHRALREGVRDGLGFGESLGRFIASHPCLHPEVSVLHRAYQLGIPMTIGSAGTCGSDEGVDTAYALIREICEEAGIQKKIAKIYSQQDAKIIKQKYYDGKINALQGAPKISEKTLYVVRLSLLWIFAKRSPLKTSSPIFL